MGIVRTGPLLALVPVLACATADQECRLDDSPMPVSLPARAASDLTKARPFHNYVAVTSVDPFGHHFTVDFDNIEPNLYYVRVDRDAAGKLHVHEESGWAGGVFPPGGPRRTPPPREVADLARAVEEELPRRCPAGKNWIVNYAGAYREVHVTEFVPHDRSAGDQRAGWSATQTLAADEALTRIVLPSPRSSSGFGLIEVRKGARWVPLDGAREHEGNRLLSEHLGGGGPLAETVLEIARRMVAGQPTPTLESVGPPPDAPLLPEGYQARVVAKVRIFGRRLNGKWLWSGQDALLALSVPDAVFGPRAEATAETTLGDRRIKLRATLTPATARDPAPALVEDRYRGMLALHLEDDQGHTWDRDYEASGAIWIEGRTAVAPTGMGIPGASSPSAAADARRGRFGGAGGQGDIEFEIDVNVFDDPRTP